MYPFQYTDLYIDNTTFVKFGPGHYVRVQLINTTYAKVISPPSLTEGSVPVEVTLQNRIPRVNPIQLTFNDQEWTNNGIPFYYYQPPYTLELEPNFGALEGGTNVTVYGANFYDSKQIKCRFDDAVVEGHYIDATRIWCLSPPANHSGYADFSMAIIEDRYSGKDLKFLYIDPPVVTSVSPTCGPTTGLTQLTIIGKNFVYIGINKAQCIFGDNIYQPATIVNETLMYCDSPPVVDSYGNNPSNISSLPLKLTLNKVDTFDAKKDFEYYTMPFLTYITPNQGPLSGGTTVVVEAVSIDNSCGLTCRFGTIEVPAKLTDTNQLTCISPPVTCPGSAVVQVSLNKQQYSANLYDQPQTVFYYYPRIITAYTVPSRVPTAGGSEVTVYGDGFLMSRNSTQTVDGKPLLTYQSRYVDGNSGKVLGTFKATYVDNTILRCPTPALNDPTDNIVLEISPNGQDWETVSNGPLSFYRAPEVLSVDPKFGKIKQKDAKLHVDGKYFECPDSGCTAVKCAFSTSDLRVVTDGVLEDSTTIICDIPPISRPEVATVQVSLNGIDYTTQKVNYTFYDAFVLSVDPPYVPLEGNTVSSLKGYGFADTGQLKVQLRDSNTGDVLICNNDPCTLPATFVSQTEVQFTVPPQSTVYNQSGFPIGFQPMVIEASVYDDTFTNNGVQMQYFKQPTVGSVDPNNAPQIFHTNSVRTMRVPVVIYVPEGTTRETFLNFAKIRCRYRLANEVIDTVGVIASYPFPSQTTTITNQNDRIECPTPQFSTTGKGTLSVSLNGRDFVGSTPVLIKQELKILDINPKSGPNEGGTKVVMDVQGFDDFDSGKMFFTWSTVCTELLTADSLIASNKIATIAPPAPTRDQSSTLR